MKPTTFKIRSIVREKEAFNEAHFDSTPPPKTYTEKNSTEGIDSLRIAVLQLIKASKAPILQARDRMVAVGALKIDGGEYQAEGSGGWTQVKAWMGEVCSEVLSAGFHMHVSGQMSYEQAKAYCCEGILRNIARFVEVNQVSSKFYQSIDRLLRDKLLPYLGLKYPPSTSNGVNKRLNRLFKQVNNSEVLTNDFFYNNNDIEFGYRESGEYNDLIMRVLNRIIDVADLPVTNQKEERTNFEFFEEYMGNLFEKVYDEKWMVGKEGRNIQDEEKDSLYREKVKEYTHFLIGRKIPLSVSEYSQAEIRSGFVSIKSSAVLRIITKWCQELWEKFENQNYFVDRTQGLLMLKGKQINTLYSQTKNVLQRCIKEEKKQIQKYFKKIEKNNFEMQSSIIQMEKRENIAEFIKKDERICGSFSAKIIKNLQNYIILYLNRLIHGLMKVSRRFCREINQEQKENWYYPPNLLSFKVGDLLRCKCSSKEREIVKIFQEMQKISQSTPQVMRIIRVKNRLSLGTNDVLINVRFNNCVTAEVQLKVETGSVDSKFSQCSYNFSHLIYELQRAQFGPLSEMCSIWMNFDPKAKLYQRLIILDKPKTDFIQRTSLCTINNKEHTLQEAQNSPFICTICVKTYSNNNFVVPHQKCCDCQYWKCAMCFIKQKEKTNLIDLILEQDVRSKCQPIRCKKLPTYFLGIFIQSRMKEVTIFQVITLEKKYLLKVKDDKLQLVQQLATQKQIGQLLETYLIFEISAKAKSYFYPNTSHQQIIRDQIFRNYVQRCYKSQKQTISLNDLMYENQRHVDVQDLSVILQGTKQQRKCVKSLSLAMNYFSNPDIISPEFINLQFLNVNKNRIQNLQHLRKFPHLQSIFAQSNNITCFPKELCSLKLKYLILQNNQISELPAEIGNLHSLQFLRLDINNIKIFPQSFRNLKNLMELSVNGNSITSIENIASPKLEILALNYNKISVIPQVVEKLVNLSDFSVSSNQITTIKAQLSKLKKLKIINLNDNPLTSFPAALDGIVSSKIDMTHTNITDIPQEISFPNVKEMSLSRGTLKNIGSMKVFENAQKLILSVNQISQLPNDVSFLKKIKDLNLNNNKLSVFPTAFFDLRLVNLDISQNCFTYLQKEFGRMKTLESLVLKSNKITSLPASIANMQNLSTLDVSFNPIDHFPEEMIGMKKLKNVKFISTKITQMPLVGLNANVNFKDLKLETLPSIMPRLEIVQLLILNNNNLRTIPDSISQMVNLRYLSVTENQLESIGNGIFQLKNLTQLLLQNNSLAQIPDKFDKLEKLQKLDLSLNQLTRIPNSICSLIKENFVIRFDKNPLQLIPAPIIDYSYLMPFGKSIIVVLMMFKLKDFPLVSKAQKITQIDLSNNKFEKLPISLSQYKNLQKLNMSFNVISSFLPSMDSLSKLKILDLTENNIQQIPKQFAQLKGLKKLLLLRNPLKRVHKNVVAIQLQQMHVNVQCLGELSNSKSLANIFAKEMILQDDSIENVPQCVEELRNVKGIEGITFKEMKCIRTLPKTIANIQKLKSLCISKCRKLRELPEEMSNLSELLSLSIVGCDLQTLPAFITKLTSLKRLELSTNKIKQLPEDMGALDRLTELNVQQNRLTVLPDTISALSKLQVLNIRNNQIKALPVGLSNCLLLKELNAASNKIQVVFSQISLLKNIAKGSLNLFSNPIKQMDCIDFVLEKGNKLTVDFTLNFSRGENK